MRHAADWLLLLMLFNWTRPAHAEEEDFSVDPAEFSAIRIEHEDKLFVPADQAGAVWVFLEQHYVKDQKNVQALDSQLTSYANTEEFWDTYYDTPDLRMYKAGSGVRYRRRINLTNPDDRKSGRELVQIKLNDIGQGRLSRGEEKFEVDRTRGGGQPFLLNLVKNSQRDRFKTRLLELGLDPALMRPVLTVHDLRRRIYIQKDAKSYISISFDTVDSRVWWAQTSFYEIEPELNEIAYTKADARTRKHMEKVLAVIVRAIHEKFPDVRQNLTPKYRKSFDGILQKLPFFRFLIIAQLNNDQGLAVALAFIIALIGIVAYGIKRSTMR